MPFLDVNGVSLFYEVHRNTGLCDVGPGPSTLADRPSLCIRPGHSHSHVCSSTQSSGETAWEPQRFLMIMGFASPSCSWKEQVDGLLDKASGGLHAV